MSHHNHYASFLLALFTVFFIILVASSQRRRATRHSLGNDVDLRKLGVVREIMIKGGSVPDADIEIAKYLKDKNGTLFNMSVPYMFLAIGIFAVSISLFSSSGIESYVLAIVGIGLFPLAVYRLLRQRKIGAFRLNDR